jgi:hypothetical protein
MKETLSRQNSAAISLLLVLSCLVLSTGNCQRALVDESEMIRKQTGKHNTPEMVAVQG